jgi:hypothetical protein
VRELLGERSGSLEPCIVWDYRRDLLRTRWLENNRLKKKKLDTIVFTIISAQDGILSNASVSRRAREKHFSSNKCVLAAGSHIVIKIKLRANLVCHQELQPVHISPLCSAGKQSRVLKFPDL